MQHTFVLCLVAAVLVAAVCGSGQLRQGDGTVPFPGPSALKADPSFTVLVDSTDISDDPFLVLGTQRTFEELRNEVVPKLEANGWSIRHPAPNPRAHITDDDVIAAEKGADCIHYWNMNEGAWAAAWNRWGAAQENPDFERQASAFTTVFKVAVRECA